MKHTTKQISFVIILSLILAITGCKKDSSNPSSPQSGSGLVGTWILTNITAVTTTGTLSLTADQANEHITITLNSDETFLSTTVDASGTTKDGGTYSFDSSNITLKSNSGDSLIWNYTLNGSDLLVKSTITVATLGTIPVTLDFKKQ